MREITETGTEREVVQRRFTKRLKGVQRYGASCTAQLPLPAEPREEAPHCRPYFNL